MKMIEDRINGLVKTLLDDYESGRVIDEVKSFDHPDKEKEIPFFQDEKPSDRKAF